jgi:hypothetical protein
MLRKIAYVLKCHIAYASDESKEQNMTRALQKHVARRQDQTFADWFAELRELAGERWADVADQAPTIYAVWGGGATPAQASPAEGSGGVGP